MKFLPLFFLFLFSNLAHAQTLWLECRWNPKQNWEVSWDLVPSFKTEFFQNLWKNKDKIKSDFLPGSTTTLELKKQFE